MTVALATPHDTRLQLRAAVADLSDALTYASLTPPRRTASPTLDSVVVTAEAGTAEVTRLDYDCAAAARLTADGVGHATVGRRRLHDLLRGLDPHAEVRLDADDTRLTVRCGNVIATLPLAACDLPPLPAGHPAPVAVLGEQPLAALRRVTVTAGTDATVPVLTAVEFRADDGELVAAATDRYRLTVLRTGVAADLPAPLLVPAKPLADVLKFTTARSRSARGIPTTLGRIEQDGNCQAMLSSAGYTTVLRTVDGDFPQWRTLLPTEFTGRARVTARSLRDAVAQVKLAVGGGGRSDRRRPARPMILDLVSGGECRASAGDDGDCQVTVPLDAAYEGEPMRVAFNPVYLADGATVLGGDELDINLVSRVKPALLTNPADTAMSYLLMPIRLAA